MTIYRLLAKWESEDNVKQAKVFTNDEIATFLNDAPNDHAYVPMKVALIFGIISFRLILYS